MKIVVGILKDSRSQIKGYEEKGYHIISLDESAQEFACRLIANREFTDEEIARVRQSGYSVSSSYWVNMALMSARDHEKIVISDLQEEDNKLRFSKVI